MPDEVWKSVPASRLLGVPAGRYEASAEGQVRGPRKVLSQWLAGVKTIDGKDGLPAVKAYIASH